MIPISKPYITENDISCVTDAVKSGWVSSLGSYIDKFEKKFADYCGVSYALSTSNGTTALHLALVSLGISSDDEVIVPDLTFVATANAVKYTGADVVLVDIDKDTLCLDYSKIEQSITSRTKAIIPVHLYGCPANMKEINRIAKKHNLFVIEDAAEAHGAEVNKKRVGSISDCGVFSFYGNKIITSGEGGMVTTNNEELYEKMKKLRDHAMSKEKRYWHDEIGFNYRMTNLQAALGYSQLENIEYILNRKKEIFELYAQELSSVPNIRMNYQFDNIKNVYWMVCIEINDFDYEKRDEFIDKLLQKEVDSRPYFYPLSSLPMYKKDNVDMTSLSISQRGINLPSFVTIKDFEIQYICDTVKSLLK